MPAGRPRSKLRYLTEPFYLAMAHERHMSPELVRRRSERRLHAFELVRGRQTKKGHGNHYRGIWGADNPFMESHAWKFLMRSALTEYARKRRTRAPSENTAAQP